jgi:hypothetical protein
MTGRQVDASTTPTADRDPYDASGPVFPTKDFDEVRPTGANFRVGRGWIFVAVLVLAMGGIIASDQLSKSSPAKAQGQVGAIGFGSVPEPNVRPEPEAKPAAAKTEETKQVKGGQAPPPKRKTALGRKDSFDNPVEVRAAREVASWNPSQKQKGGEPVANRRQSALGNER